ncbi:uncharacterized protein Z518_00779 [Rhinocladiella mackenziei CBS 650.93]|uniref:GST N-terminal domain-containing protein n=1 Tax=Rhinocladiella mackenziei CBS 650.93 TaxID=1442369 RepID=A0A0D2HG96_9EURO|nr:uncharacterized protein Z518_00779 [Rhinocladiella mackenziei CBS 650.93]KIX09698.1 hypothetical protein Z518_00779 [Rhinocladiella mackenziei CBS 650.93]
MTQYLHEYYPSLYPSHLAVQINKLLAQLHEINYFSLTYTRRPDRASDMLNAVEKRLADPGISKKYRTALEHKRKVILSTRAPALDASFIKKEEDKTVAFLSQVTAVMDASCNENAPWIFGTEVPTALDAHMIPFLARLVDVDRENMLGSTSRRYLEMAMETRIWTDTMQGRRTVHGTYLPAK